MHDAARLWIDPTGAAYVAISKALVAIAAEATESDLAALDSSAQHVGENLDRGRFNRHGIFQPNAQAFVAACPS
jgi:hypothetical protein